MIICYFVDILYCFLSIQRWKNTQYFLHIDNYITDLIQSLPADFTVGITVRYLDYFGESLQFQQQRTRHFL